MYSCGPARSHLQEFGAKSFARDDWLDGFRNFVDLEAEAIGHHRYRFRQSMMLDSPRGNLLFKLLGAQPCAHLLLQRQPPLRCIHDARYAYRIHSLCGGAQRQHELIHDKARIHPRADQRHAPGFRLLIQLRGQIRIFAIGIGELLTSRDHARFRGQTGGELIHHAG